MESIEGQVVRVYIGEEDVWRGERVSHAIVRKAHELGLDVAAVRRGILGYGAGGSLRTLMVADVPSPMPLVIEIAGSAEKVLALRPFLEEMVGEGLIAIEPVRMLVKRGKSGAPPPRPAV